MPNAPTPNLGLTVPTVGADANNWGNELNTDLGILDELALSGVLPVNSNFAANPSAFGPEIFYQVTTGSANVTGTLPAASTCPGKIINMKKMDDGTGQAILLGNIDGQTSYIRAAQYSFVRVISNGSVWSVVAYG